MENEQNLENGCLVSSEGLREAMGMLPCGCQIIHPDGRLLYVNAAMARRFNCPGRQIPGQALVDLWPGIETTPMFIALEQCMLDRQPCSMEAEVSFPDGFRDCCQISFNRIADGVCMLFVEQSGCRPSQEFDGKMADDLGIACDITERRQMEEELRDSRNLLDTTQQLAHVGGWAWDIVRQTMTWTDETYRIHDFTPGEVEVGSPEHIKKSIACYDPEERNLVQEAFRLCVENGVPYSLTCRFISAKGIRKWVQTIGQPVFRGRNVVKVIGNIIDITERKQAEEALRESEQKWRNILIRTPQVGIALNPEAQIVFANTNFLKLTGWREEEILGQNWFDLFIPDNEREEIRAIFDKVMHSQDTGPYPTNENAIVTKNGQRRNIAWSNVLTKNVDGDIVDVTCLGVDVTERKRAEEETRAHERYVSTILHTAGDGFLVVDINGKVVDVNEAYCRMSGYTRDELLSMSVTDLDVNEAAADTAARIQYLVSHGSDLFESHHCRKDGSVFPVEFSVSWLDEGGGRFVSFCRDLTERKRLQEQLLQAQKMEAVGRLAGGVAHDFNNMLGAILGHAELAMIKAGQDESLCEDLREIIFAGKRSADITRQLLAFASKQIIQPKVLDLNRMVEDMLKMLRRLIGEDIDLVWMPGRSLLPVKMDPSQIDQILVNLCVNARDAIEGVGRLTIETGSVSFDEAYCAGHVGFVPGDFVLLAVGDNGCGMDRQTLDNLFEPFFTTKDMGKGTGLGLATVYGIIKQNQGVIKVDSEPGLGTTFHIYLPAYNEVSLEVLYEPLPALSSGSETILVVEDEPALLKMTTMILEQLGYTVFMADTPGQAIDLARAHGDKIHLLVTDVIMPLMNGRDLAQTLGSLCPQMKCLFMSGYPATVIGIHGVLDEGVQFLAKPFSMGDIALKVRQVLDGKI